MAERSISYVVACTPRVGSHMLSDALTSTGIAGRPREWLPRFSAENAPKTPGDRFRLVTQPPMEVDSDTGADSAHIRRFLAAGTTDNGVFGIVTHWFVLQDAARRLQGFLDTSETAPHRILSSAFPGLEYVWLRRHNRAAQAVSWYRAIQTGRYVGAGDGEDRPDGEVEQFDYARIRYLYSAITSHENAWASFFESNGLTPLVLYYEDLAAHYESTVRGVLGFLELDAEGVEIAPPKHDRYAGARSRAWIERFERLHNRRVR